MNATRLPAHVGFIPDGNRRWAEERGAPRREGYRHGVDPGLRLLERCVQLGIAEVSIYGFTKENVHRPPDQVAAFRDAVVAFARAAVDLGAALRVVGDVRSDVFPAALRPWAEARTPGGIRVNLLVNYGWQWDLHTALERARAGVALSWRTAPGALASGDVSRVDLVVRWGGRRRLSGFLPMQTAYADFFAIDALWPDMRLEDLDAALAWYAAQDVTLGG